MRLLVTGGSGALGKAFLPLARAHGHEVRAPARVDLDLFDPVAVGAAVHEAQGVLHLATRIPAASRRGEPGAWDENDRLRSEAAGILVDAARNAGTVVFVQPTITFVYPPAGTADESTPVVSGPPYRSVLVAEGHARRFDGAGRRGVVLRLGLLDGSGTGSDRPNPVFGATLHTADAASALLAALGVPGDTYNVCRDGERVSNAKFSRAAGWRPVH